MQAAPYYSVVRRTRLAERSERASGNSKSKDPLRFVLRLNHDPHCSHSRELTAIARQRGPESVGETFPCVKLREAYLGSAWNAGD
jgi:hypothetical protein